jgi:hypothetical protein
MVLITTSNGVFRLAAEDPAPSLVLRRQPGFLFLRKGAGGFFGIAAHPAGDSYLAASREKLGTPRHDKPWTDVRLYRIWKEIDRPPVPVRDLKDVHDVHQMATAGPLVILTDTGKNRLVVHDLESQRTWPVNVGPERADINHLNALCVEGDHLLVGLNNRGNKAAEILELPLSALRSEEPIDALARGRLEVLGKQLHTHDIEQVLGDHFYCASHDGQVHRRSTGDVVLSPGGWVRGLAVNGAGLWVGASPLAERSQRHREDLDGQVHLYDLDTWALKQTWQLTGAGQVNDIVAW